MIFYKSYYREESESHIIIAIRESRGSFYLLTTHAKREGGRVLHGLEGLNLFIDTSSIVSQGL